MKEFLIFHSRANDPLLAVQKIHNIAQAQADSTGKDLAVRDIDIDTASASDLAHYSGGGTIECVTVSDGTVKERAKNPGAAKVKKMVDRL